MKRLLLPLLSSLALTMAVNLSPLIAEPAKITKQIERANLSFNLGLSNYKRSNYSEAIHYLSSAVRDINTALESQSSNPNLYMLRGLIYGWQRAALSERASIGLGSPEQQNSDFSLSYMFSELAINDFTTAMQIDPNLIEAYVERGNEKMVLMGVGKPKDAIKDYSEAIKLKPDFAEAYIRRGLANKKLSTGLFSKKPMNKSKVCPDWEKAYSLGSKEAAVLLTKHCK